MKFSKLEADIPDCCRLDLRFDGLNADAHLDQLADPDNVDHDVRARLKWDLLDNRTDRSELLDVWPELDRLIAEFPGTVYKAHISLLPPGRVLNIHRDGIDRRDQPRTYFEMFNTTLRFHVPLRTNAGALIYTRERYYTMGEGECWMLHNMQYHGAVNRHESEGRFHLILDVEPDASTMALLEKGETNLGFADDSLFERYWPNEDQR